MNFFIIFIFIISIFRFILSVPVRDENVLSKKLKKKLNKILHNCVKKEKYNWKTLKKNPCK